MKVKLSSRRKINDFKNYVIQLRDMAKNVIIQRLNQLKVPFIKLDVDITFLTLTHRGKTTCR